MDLQKASKNLDSLDIKIEMGNLYVNVLGFRSDGFHYGGKGSGWKWPSHKHFFMSSILSLKVKIM